MEKLWLKEALFGGVGANAFKLGTVLTCGWFWLRVDGCSVLYRGGGMETIDFTIILAVAAVDAGQITVPSYVGHDSGSTYFYVVRRVNNCGDQEHTLSAAVKVPIGGDGDLAEPKPNNVFKVKVRRADSNKIELVWYYCPIGQESEPSRFMVYWDGGTGQIGYENPIGIVRYEGRRFYNYTSGPLGAGTYLFCIRASDVAYTENDSVRQVGLQLDAVSPEAIDILKSESV